MPVKFGEASSMELFYLLINKIIAKMLKMAKSHMPVMASTAFEGNLQQKQCLEEVLQVQGAGFLLGIS